MTPQEGPGAAPPVPAAPRRTYTVLLIDDQPAFLELARESLEVAPWLRVVGTALGAEDALGAAAALKPDLAIVDVFMPGMNGFETTRRLIQMLPQLKVVIVSAEGYPEHPALARSVGALGFLDKRHLRPGALLRLLEPPA